MAKKDNLALHNYVRRGLYVNGGDRHHLHHHMATLVKNHRPFLYQLKSQRKMLVHEGCVNTLAWNSNGEFILSGSDDFNLCITKPNMCDFNERNYTVKHKILSGHRANIFSAQFMPFTSDTKITSSSSSGSIIVSDVNSPETSGTCLFECHKFTCYEVAPILDQPCVFMSCSEDKTIRLFDLRTTQSCLGPNCQKNILIRDGYSITTISINPINPDQFLVGRSDGTGVLYDRRKIYKDSDLSYGKHNLTNGDTIDHQHSTSDMNRGDKLQSSSSTSSSSSMNGQRVRRLNHPAHGAVARFTVPGFTDTHRFTSLCFSPDGREVLASYSSEHIYLFNVDRSSNITLNKCIDRNNGKTLINSKPWKSEQKKNVEDTQNQPKPPSSELQRRTFRLRGDWSDTGPNSRPMGPIENEADEDADEPEAESEVRDQRQSFMSRLTRAANEGLRTVRSTAPNPPVFIDIRGILNRGSREASVPQRSRDLSFSQGSSANQSNDSSQTRSDNSSARQTTDSTTVSPVEFLWDQTFSFTTDDDDSSDEDPNEDDEDENSINNWSFTGGQDATQSSSIRPNETIGMIDRHSGDVDPRLPTYSNRTSSTNPSSGLESEDQVASGGTKKRGKSISEASKLKFNQSFKKTLEAVMQIPSFQPKRVFKGHRNCRTAINEATFWGSDYIVSGSDCGHIFMWDKHTAEVVTIFQGDERVVNCIAPNPMHYCLATSGIDYDIKLWSTQFQEHEPLRMSEQKKQKIIKINEQMIQEDSNTIIMPPHVFFRLLASLASARIMAVEGGNVNEGMDISYE